jgi:hypothetical protein
MIPITDSAETIGGVFLPGAMAGAIVAGAYPLEAVRSKTLVVYTLLGSVYTAAIPWPASSPTAPFSPTATNYYYRWRRIASSPHAVPEPRARPWEFCLSKATWVSGRVAWLQTFS